MRANQTIDPNLVDVNLVAFARDGVDETNLLFPNIIRQNFVRQFNDGEINVRVNVTVARVQIQNAIAFDARARWRERRADYGFEDGVRVLLVDGETVRVAQSQPAQAILGVYLIAQL